MPVQAESTEKNKVTRQIPSHISSHIPSQQIEADVNAIKQWIRKQAFELGFADCGFVAVDNPVFAEQMSHLKSWLDKGYEGQLQFLHNHHELRADPAKLVTGTKTIVSVRMDYLYETPKRGQVEDDLRPNSAIVARYARGRDYHKVMRSRLKQLAKRIEAKLADWQALGVDIGDDFVFRPFADSAPIFERAIADTAGLGWTGKHTLLINKNAGSLFVLGELFISLELPEDKPLTPHCGSCTACIDVCPTRAIVAPYQVDASACISYLTIEHDGSIPVEYRKAIGNRIFGCDDCQLVCPWNRYANLATLEDFAPRHGLDNLSLLDMWAWSQQDFEDKTQGSPLRRTGYLNLLRNIAIALGNAEYSETSIDALQSKLGNHGDMLDEHINWALAELMHKKTPPL